MILFNEKRGILYNNYVKALEYFTKNPEKLIDIEYLITELVNEEIRANYDEIKSDYDEASYLNPFWANYPPADRGRAPIGDQIPWIEVGEQAVGHKLGRVIGSKYSVSEIGLPSGADNRFVIYHDGISKITEGNIDCAFVFLDIKSAGPRDDFDHIVLSPYQVSGDGIWVDPNENLSNTYINAKGKNVSHHFYPAMSPLYSLTDGRVAPSVHLFVKPVYAMLTGTKRGQPLESIKNICVPNGVLLCRNPGYLTQHPGLFFPGKDDRGKNPLKVRARVSFSELKSIASWRIQEFN